MPIDCAEFCPKCGLYHLASFECDGTQKVEEPVADEAPAVEAPADEAPAAEVSKEDVAPESADVAEAAEAVEAVAEAVADGVVTSEEKGHVLDELDDVTPKKSGRKKSAE